MRLRSCVITAAAACLCLSSALAQEPPQVVRQNLMKEIGRSVGAMGAIAKGEKPYDAAVVEQSLTTIRANIEAFPDQFPAGTEDGYETEALPAVWENPAFLVAMPGDQAAVGEAMRRLGATCSDCHETFRVKK